MSSKPVKDLESENRKLRAALELLLEQNAVVRKDRRRPEAPAAPVAPAARRRTIGPKSPIDPKFLVETKVCPKCKRRKVIWNGGDKSIEDFGVRIHRRPGDERDTQRPQPWCRKCRATTNYHNLPRKNRTVNNP